MKEGERGKEGERRERERGREGEREGRGKRRERVVKATRLSQKGSLVFDLMLLLSAQLDFKQSALSTVGATIGKKK